MKELKRTRIGNFKIEDAGKLITLESALEFMENDVNTSENTLSEKKELKNYKNLNKGISLKECDYKKILNGVKIKVGNIDELKNEEKLSNRYGLINLYYNDEFIGIGQIEEGFLKRKIIVK